MLFFPYFSVGAGLGEFERSSSSSSPSGPLLGEVDGVGVSVGFGVGVGESVGFGVGAADAVGDAEGVGLGVTDGVGVGDAVGVIDGVGDAVGVGVPVPPPEVVPKAIDFGIDAYVFSWRTTTGTYPISRPAGGVTNNPESNLTSDPPDGASCNGLFAHSRCIFSARACIVFFSKSVK